MRTSFLSSGIAALLAVSLGWSSTASAQEANEVDPDGKGIIGCALLGGEAALLVESAIGVRNGWALGLIPAVTAIGGGIGGYFLEQNADAEWSVASLVVGMALIIPTTIIVLKTTAYSTEEEEGWVDAIEDQEDTAPPSDSEGTSVEQVNEPAPAETQPEPPPAEAPPADTAPPPEGGGAPPAGPSGSLFDIRPGRLAIGIPAVGVGGAYSAAEVRRWGLTQHSELRVPLLSAAF